MCKKMICKKKQVNSSLSQFVVRKKKWCIYQRRKIFFETNQKICSCTRQKKKRIINNHHWCARWNQCRIRCGNFLATQLTNERLTIDPGHALENEFLHGNEEWWGWDSKMQVDTKIGNEKKKISFHVAFTHSNGLQTSAKDEVRKWNTHFREKLPRWTWEWARSPLPQLPFLLPLFFSLLDVVVSFRLVATFFFLSFSFIIFLPHKYHHT